MVPGMFERTSSQPAWSEKEAIDNSESGIATSTEGGGDEMVQENIEMWFQTLQLLWEFLKSQPIIKESNPFNAPLILVVEVKSDTLAAKISDIEAALLTHDSSPIIASINSNSQQSQ
nr:hypothetical protein CFP56_38203 [Quercus suber]